MELFTSLLFLLIALRCALSFEERDVLSHVDKFSVSEYIRKDNDADHGKLQATEYFEKIAEDFSDDINAAKEALQNMFLDVEASFEELSDDVAKSVSQYSYDAEEKLNILEGLVNEFVESKTCAFVCTGGKYVSPPTGQYMPGGKRKINKMCRRPNVPTCYFPANIPIPPLTDSKGVIFNSPEEKKMEKHKFKKMCDIILEKVKTVVELSTINNYRIILKFGKGERKSEVIDKVKNDDNISDELKSELLKYEDVESKDANVSGLINFISPIYDSFEQKLNALIREVSADLGKII